MTNLEAIQNVRELGRIFEDALYLHGQNISKSSELSSGLVAYEMLKLKGQWEYIDESVDIVMRIIYKEVKARVETTNEL